MNKFITFTFRSIFLIEIILILGGCKFDRPEIKCNFNQVTFIREIQNELSADTVEMISLVLKEEPYFPTLIAINLIIDNPTTTIYDFKNFDLENPSRFDDFETVENKFKVLGNKYALRIINDCDLKEFNDILIDFGKTDKKGIFHQIFTCHYSDLLIHEEHEK